MQDEQILLQLSIRSPTQDRGFSSHKMAIYSTGLCMYPACFCNRHLFLVKSLFLLLGVLIHYAEPAVNECVLDELSNDHNHFPRDASGLVPSISRRTSSLKISFSRIRFFSSSRSRYFLQGSLDDYALLPGFNSALASLP